QGGDDTVAHLRGGLAGERDGDDLLGLFHGRKQHQISLDQQLGLARSGRCLNDERLRRVEGGPACGLIRHCPSCSRALARRCSASCSRTRVSGAKAPAAGSASPTKKRVSPSTYSSTRPPRLCCQIRISCGTSIPPPFACGLPGNAPFGHSPAYRTSPARRLATTSAVTFREASA